MARLDFANFNGLPMATVKNNIKKVVLAKPLTIDDSAGNVSANITGFLEVGNNDIVRLVTMDSYGNSFTLSSENLVKKIFPDPLTVNNLTVNDVTILGTGDTSDEIHLQGEVIGLAVPNASYTDISAPTVSINFDTVTANHFIGGDFDGTTVHASIGDFDNLKVGGQPYRPFVIASVAPTGTNVQNRLWINTANNIVPIVMYCDLDASDTTTNASAGNWHPLGAVFG